MNTAYSAYTPSSNSTLRPSTVFSNSKAMGPSGLQPVDVGEVPGLGAVVDDDEEVEVRMVVEPVEVGADRPEPEQRQRIAPIGEHPAELVESGEQPPGHVGGHGRESTTRVAVSAPSSRALAGATNKTSERRHGD